MGKIKNIGDDKMASKKGYFGEFGGSFIPDFLQEALKEVEECFCENIQDPNFLKELDYYYKQYVGRSNPLYFAKRLTEETGGAKICLKREDLNHTGAHKINNAVGQILLAKKWERKELLRKQVLDSMGLQQQQRVPCLD